MLPTELGRVCFPARLTYFLEELFPSYLKRDGKNLISNTSFLNFTLKHYDITKLQTKKLLFLQLFKDASMTYNIHEELLSSNWLRPVQFKRNTTANYKS